MPSLPRCQKPPAASSANLNDLLENTRRQRITVLTEAVQVTFDCFTDIFGRFCAGSALGNASRQGRAGCYKYPVLVWLQINAILHYPAFYQSLYPPVPTILIRVSPNYCEIAANHKYIL